MHKFFYALFLCDKHAHSNARLILRKSCAEKLDLQAVEKGLKSL